jgi:hypothetical protein
LLTQPRDHFVEREPWCLANPRRRKSRAPKSVDRRHRNGQRFGERSAVEEDGRLFPVSPKYLFKLLAN